MRLLPLSLWFLNLLPLWIVVVFRDVRSILADSGNVGAEWCGIIGGALGLLFSFGFVCWCLYIKGNESDSTLKSAIEMKALTAESLLMYVFPMVAFDFCRWEGLLEFLVFFIIVAVLCVRQRIITGNVVLVLLGFRFYRCELDNFQEFIVITRDNLAGEEGKAISYISLSNNEVVLVRKKK
jgi:hypothetical protein